MLIFQSCSMNLAPSCRSQARSMDVVCLCGDDTNVWDVTEEQTDTNHLYHVALPKSKCNPTQKRAKCNPIPKNVGTCSGLRIEWFEIDTFMLHFLSSSSHPKKNFDPFSPSFHVLKDASDHASSGKEISHVQVRRDVKAI